MILVEIAALVLAIWALRRAGKVDALEARLRALETEVRVLHGLLRSTRSALGEAAVPALAAEPLDSEERAEEVAAAPPALADLEVEPEAEPAADEEPPRVAAEAPPLVPPPDEPAAAPAFAPQIDWERWLGVRGAAVLGGVVLALAATFFFRYSIEHGLIPPWLRVVAGTLVGIFCIVASERYLRERYAWTGDALTGAGVVILYASAWAARVLYELIGTPAAFVLMIAVTVACCALSWSHASLVIAMIGLIGGFATPFMLASGSDNPIGLFAYVFLLDAALLYLSRRQRWPLLALLSLIGTTIYQATWILGSMDAGRIFVGLSILGISAALFALAGPRATDGEEEPAWVATQAAGLLLPLVFVGYMTTRVQLSPHLLPLALLVALISAAACWIASWRRVPWLALAAAAGAVGVVGVWTATHALSPQAQWEIAGAAVLLAAVFHLAVEREPEIAGTDGPAPAAIVAAGGLFWVMIAAAAPHQVQSEWPWLAGWLGIAALLLRHASFPRRAWLHLAVGAGLALGLGNAASLSTPAVRWSIALAVGLALQAVPLLRRDGQARLWADHGAALFAALALLSLPLAPAAGIEIAPLGLGTAIVLGLFIALAAARLARGEWLLAAVLLTAWCHWIWLPQLAHGAAENPGTWFALECIAVLLFAAFPFAVAQRFRDDRFAWAAAAIAGAVWFPSLRSLFDTTFGSGAIGLLPVALGAVALVQGWRAREVWAAAEPARSRNLVWFFVVAMGFLTVAIPLQLEKEWITIGWALEGLGVLLLWRRFDVAWLKLLAVALLVGVTVRLVANPAVLGYYPRPSWRIVNWLLYTYLVPAAALFASAAVLRPLEVARARGVEERFYASGRPLAAVVLGFCAVLVAFVWVNLAIVDWFSSGPTLSVSLDRLPARDLAMSISWALYALLLLAAGVRVRSVGVRWASLTLMIITIAKVFLYDLGELRDLYRVASLLGLAISLIAVSLAYQRFVLSIPAEDAAAEKP